MALFQERLKERGGEIPPRYSPPPIESFRGSLENELVHHIRYATRSEAYASVQEYIEILYNRPRRHSRLGYPSHAVFAEKYDEIQAVA